MSKITSEMWDGAPPEKPNLPAKIKRRELVLRDDFERHARKVSEQYILDIDDVRQAYADRPDSLSALYNSMAKAKEGRGRNVFWGIAAVIFIPILTPLAAYCFYRNTQKINWVRDNVKKSIEDMREAELRALPKPDKPSGSGDGMKMT